MEAAPFYSDVAYGPERPEITASAFWLTTEDGLRIRLGVWPEGTKGTVLLFPGRTEYVEKYGEAAREFQARGLATIAIDWRGQGLGQRMLPTRDIGHVVEFADYQHDVKAVLAAVEQLDLPKPLYLMAHSMGGCIGLRALMDGMQVKAACFSAPMWGLAPSPLIPVAWVLSTAMRPIGLGDMRAPSTSPTTYVLEAPFEDNTLTTDPEMWQFMRNQVSNYGDLALGGPSVRWLNEALHEMLALSKRPAPDVPCVTFLGSNERIVSAERIKTRMPRWKDGALEILEGAEHEVMMEREDVRKFVFDRAADHYLAA
ncbi:MAG: alpha/beta hydrolase [Pseudomonadota bacterium]